MQAAVKRVMAAAAKHNIPVGGPGGAAAVKPMIDAGFRFIQGPASSGFLQSAARDFFSAIKTAGVQKKEPAAVY